MASTSLTVICRLAALSFVSGLGIERRRLNLRVHGDSWLKRKRPRLLSGGLGRRRSCVQAAETSSRSTGAKRRPFVRPRWLFAIENGSNTEGNSDIVSMEESTSGRSFSSNQIEKQNRFDALYYIIISTSKDDKSGLSEPNSGILLSMIAENGEAILHKIPGTENFSDLQNRHSGEGTPKHKEYLRFQRGAVDITTVVGPDLGRLAALWIAPEAGTWRVDRVSVTILPRPEELVIDEKLSGGDIASLVISNKLKESAASGEWNGLFHVFQSDEALLGDDAWFAAVELKPYFIKATSDAVEVQERLLKLSPQLPRSLRESARLRDESMVEYEDLKLSLLSFSSLLVLVGTASLAILGQGKLAEGFAVGGVGGFAYLLLLQRAVDQLLGSLTANPSEAQKDKAMPGNVNDTNSTARQSMEDKGGDDQGRSIANSRSSRSTLIGRGNLGLPGRVALVAGVVLLLGKLTQGEAVGTISPTELLAGIIGFLTSKVAVAMVAMKPMSSGDK